MITRLAEDPALPTHSDHASNDHGLGWIPSVEQAEGTNFRSKEGGAPHHAARNVCLLQIEVVPLATGVTVCPKIVLEMVLYYNSGA